MKIEIEIPDYVDKKLLTEDLITEMKISAYIPLVEKWEMTMSAISDFLNVSMWDISDYFERIGYTGFRNVDKDLEDDPEYKKYKEESIKIMNDYFLDKNEEDKK